MRNKWSAFLGMAIVVTAWLGCGGSSSTDILSSASPGTDAGDGTSSGSGDEGGTGDTTDAGDPYATPVVCTSGTKWTRGDRGSQSMHPGVACIDCHDKNFGPTLTIAGTVYPTAHEPDDCNGVNGTVKIVITDANNKTFTLTANSAGNFYTQSDIAMPFKAKVVSGTKERAMTASQTTGDCNSCHTVAGTQDAPGRIMAP